MAGLSLLVASIRRTTEFSRVGPIRRSKRYPVISGAFFCLRNSTIDPLYLNERIVGMHRPHLAIQIGECGLIWIERECRLDRVGESAQRAESIVTRGRFIAAMHHTVGA